MKRRIAAIMVGDVVGYSAMMERAEERTVERLNGCQTVVADKVRLLDGRIFNTAGDATLAEFPSPVNAVRCAVEIRATLAGLDSSDGEPLRMRFGIHLADVVVRGEDLLGDGINVAARIQQDAPPDSICVSGALFDHVRRNSPFIFDPVGERRFKNIFEPIQVFRVRGEIGAHRLQSAPTTSRQTGERRPSSIAVLPFRVASGCEEQRFLAEGLTEELIVELGRFRRLFVSSRSASFALAEAVRDPVKVGEALSVSFTLDGQLKKFGDRVRISLTLSETETGSVVWTERIVRQFDDLVDSLDEIIGRIAATVFRRTEDASIVATRRQRPDNMTAFECLLRGIDHLRQGGVSDENARAAVGWFTKAIEADPNYAAAYAWRVCSASWLPEFDFAEGERDILKALQLDPADPEANRIMGAIELIRENYDQAVTLTLKAIELNPSDANIKAGAAGVLTYAGKADRSLALLDEAEALDPLLPVWCVEERGVALYALGRYEDALASLGRLTFQTYRSRLYRAAALVALGRTEEAIVLVKEALVGKPDLTIRQFTSNGSFCDPDKRRELRERLEQARVPR